MTDINALITRLLAIWGRGGGAWYTTQWFVLRVIPLQYGNGTDILQSGVEVMNSNLKMMNRKLWAMKIIQKAIKIIIVVWFRLTQRW